jgi:dihydropteroate synthase
MVRVHDVKPMARIARMADAILRTEDWGLRTED